MSPQPIRIVNNLNGNLEEMIFRDDLTREHIEEAETQWGNIRRSAATKNGMLPEHHHWDWTKKIEALGLLGYRYMAIQSSSGDFEGLMMLSTVKRPALLPPDIGKPMVYIEFLETAPWNLKLLTSTPRYKGIGSRLFEASVLYSFDEGFKGRVGLHSLPQSESFYRDVCCLTCVIPEDPISQNLPYYEMSTNQAKIFISERDGDA